MRADWTAETPLGMPPACHVTMADLALFHGNWFGLHSCGGMPLSADSLCVFGSARFSLV